MWKNLIHLDTKKQEKDNASKSKSVDIYMGCLSHFLERYKSMEARQPK